MSGPRSEVAHFNAYCLCCNHVRHPLRYIFFNKLKRKIIKNAVHKKAYCIIKVFCNGFEGRNVSCGTVFNSCRTHIPIPFPFNLNLYSYYTLIFIKVNSTVEKTTSKIALMLWLFCIKEGVLSPNRHRRKCISTRHVLCG